MGKLFWGLLLLFAVSIIGVINTYYSSDILWKVLSFVGMGVFLSCLTWMAFVGKEETLEEIDAWNKNTTKS